MKYEALSKYRKSCFFLKKKSILVKKSSNLRRKTLEKLTFLGAKIRTISWVEFYPVLGFYIKL